MSERPASDSTTQLNIRFPDRFLWGAATSAYQIEGAADEDGRGACIWDTFCETAGVIANGHTGAVAADHYHRYAEDIAIARDLGLHTYRFSVSWPRVQPTGSGPVNVAGLDFYDRLTDELLRRGIQPMLTLYHWDLPQALQDAGGWVSRHTAYRFADYAQLVAARLGDRVTLWTTLNEPWCAAFLGYAAGVHAPGHIDPSASFAATHHLLLAHGLATRQLRELVPAAQVSLVLNLSPVRAASQAPVDVDAAVRVDGLLNRLFLDPVLNGSYPKDVLAATARHSDWGFVGPDDLATIATTLDALGVNYYHPTTVGGAARPTGQPSPWPGCEDVRFEPPAGPVTGMGWPVDATGLSELLVRLRRDYPNLPPVMVTENGAAFPDVPGHDGSVDDRERIAYLQAHLVALHEAIASGVDVRGYIVWSLLDNFEWAYGYDQRFGIVHVDFATQRRTVKASGRWYAEVIRRNGLDRYDPATS